MRQIDLFSTAQSRPSVPQNPDPDVIRTRLRELLQGLRSAQRMPWEGAQLRSWLQVFHNMANWLPQEERDNLRQAFSREIDRLQQV
jgi:hypothetical protein